MQHVKSFFTFIFSLFAYFVSLSLRDLGAQGLT